MSMPLTLWLLAYLALYPLRLALWDALRRHDNTKPMQRWTTNAVARSRRSSRRKQHRSIMGFASRSGGCPQ